MESILNYINYIKSWFAAPLEPTRKRRAFDEIDLDSFFVSPKIRRINASTTSNGILDEDLFGYSSIKRSPRSPITPRRMARRNPRIVDTVCLDDDDNDVQIVIPKENDIKVSNQTKSKCTSTPAQNNKSRLIMNGDDDVQVVGDFKLPSSNKKINTQRSGFSYVNPLSSLFTGSHNGTKPKPKISPVLSGMKSSSPIFTSLRKRTPVSAVDHSFRLDDKMKYKQLLEKAAPNYSGGLNDSPSIYHTPYSKLFTSYDSASRGKKMVGMVRKDGKEKTGEFVRKILDDIEKEPIEVTDSDSDVEILPAPPSPKPDIKIDPVNSLKPIVDSTEATSQNWLNELVRNHREILEQRKNEIEEYTKQYKALHDINTDIRIGTLASRVDRSLSIRDYVLPEEEKEEEEELPELTDEHLMIVKKAFSGSPNEVLVKKFNLNITRRDIITLQNLNWLNDEVINFYMNLIAERGKDHSRYPKVYTMNTFFYPKLTKDGPESLRRWTRRVDIFSYDLICIPIHLGVHWCMAIIDFREKSIKYYDSMGSSNPECTKRLKRYLEFEHKDKKKEQLDTSEFVLEDVKDIPQQMNGSDCGMFSCMFAEYRSRNAKITFTQEHMPYFRKKMVVEIIRGELMLK